MATCKLTAYVVDDGTDPRVRIVLGADMATLIGRIELNCCHYVDMHSRHEAHVTVLSARMPDGFVVDQFVGDDRGLAQAVHAIGCGCEREL